MSKVYCTHRKLKVEDKNEIEVIQPFYATDMNDLRNNKEIMAELEKLGSQI